MSSSREFYLVRRKWATSSKEACHLKPHGFRLNRRQRQQINYESIAIALIIYFVKMYDTTCSGSLLYGEPNLQTIGRDVHCFFHIMLSEMSSNKLNMGIYQTPCGRQIWLFPPSRTLIVVVAEDEEERVDHVPMVIYNGPFCTWVSQQIHWFSYNIVKHCWLQLLCNFFSATSHTTSKCSFGAHASPGEELRARQNNVPYEHYDVRVVWMNATNKADYSCVSSVS